MYITFFVVSGSVRCVFPVIETYHRTPLDLQLLCCESIESCFLKIKIRVSFLKGSWGPKQYPNVRLSMKSIILSLIPALLLLSGFQTQAKETSWPSISFSSLVADKYLAFGSGSVLSKNPVVQSDLCFSFKNGLYVDLWNSRSLQGSWNDGGLGNEIDYQIGWKSKVAKDLTLNVGVTYFDTSKVFTFGGGDIIYTHAFLLKDFKHLSVTAGYENYTTMPRSGFRGGNLISLGASKHQLFFGDKLSLRAGIACVYDTGTIGTHTGFIMRGSAGADWNISKHLTFNVIGVNYYVPLTVHDKRTTDAVVSSGITLH